jgi:hypothetical protein
MQIEAKVPEELSSSKAHKFEENFDFMPFGASHFQCPADKSGFGWRIIALLVGTISQSLEGEWEIVDGDLSPLGQALESEREDYLAPELEEYYLLDLFGDTFLE